MKTVERDLLAEIADPPVLAFPDWNDVPDGTRPCLLFCDACIDGFGATLELPTRWLCTSVVEYQPRPARLETSLTPAQPCGWQHRLVPQAPSRSFMDKQVTHLVRPRGFGDYQQS